MQAYLGRLITAGSLFCPLTRDDLIDFLGVHMDQPTALLVEHPSIRPLFDESPAESVAIGQLYHHRRWKLGYVHKPRSEIPASKFITRFHCITATK